MPDDKIPEANTSEAEVVKTLHQPQANVSRQRVTELRRHLFRNWSTAKTERKRRQLNKAIANAENDIRQARYRVIAIPRQVEETKFILDEILSYDAIREILEENGKELVLSQIEEKRDFLHRFLTQDDRIDQPLGGIESTDISNISNINFQVTGSLNLVEKLARQLNDLVENNTSGIKSNLSQELERSQKLLQKVERIREDFEQSKENPSILCDELNHLQLLLSKIRYEVSLIHRLATLKKFTSRVEQISQATQSIHSDQKDIVSFVGATTVDVERWLTKYQWNIFSIPTGWFLGWFFNRFNDTTRLFRQLSGFRGFYYSDQETAKGKIIAGLTISLLASLLISFSISIFMLGGKVVIQAIVADETKRIEAAEQEIEKVTQEVQKILKEEVKVILNPLPIQQLTNLPQNNQTALENSYEKVKRIIDSLQQNGDLSGCSINEETIDFNNESTLDRCRQQVDIASKLESTSDEQKLLLAILDLELTSLQDHKELDEELKRYHSIIIGNLNESSEADEPQFEDASEKILAQISDLKESQDILYLVDFLTSKEAKDVREKLLSLDSGSEKFTVQDLESIVRNLRNLPSEFTNATTEDPATSGNKRFEGIYAALFTWSTERVHTDHVHRFLLALLAGAIGGIISILTRIDNIEQENLSTPFLFGLLQPLIGATFSIMAMLILSSQAAEVIKILPDEFHLRSDISELSGAKPNENPLDSNEVYKILIVGFLVGFSERLAKNAFASASNIGMK